MTPLLGCWNPQSGKVRQAAGVSEIVLDELEDADEFSPDDVSFLRVK